MFLTATMRGFATSVIYQRRSLVIAVAGVSTFILLWVSLYSSPHLEYILPRLADSHPKPITFNTNSRLLPFRYWNHRSRHPESYADDTCMKFPGVKDLQFAASSWQLLKVEDGNVYVYGAYYDDRFEDPMVRILIYTDVTPVPSLFCQLWFPNDNVPQTELAVALYGWLAQWEGYIHGVNEPYILSCKYRRHEPDKNIAPIAAAVVTRPCGVATNVLDIQNAPFFEPLDEKTKQVPSPRNGTSIAVCVKWLYFRNDVSVKIIEWMQLMKHFGVEKVYLYIVKLHYNARKVLKYYEDLGFAVVTELSHPPQLSGLHVHQNIQDYRDLRRELLPLNDCLYRSLRKHDWLVAIDLDEMIVPTPEDSWITLIQRKTTDAAGFPFDTMIYPNYFVLDGAQQDLEGPSQTRILSHTWRARHQSPRNHYVKAFVRVSSVTAMHNHIPIACYYKCRNTAMDNGPGKLLHYREKCSYNEEDCMALHDVIKEDNLGRWRALVLAEIDEVLDKLGLESLE